MFALDHRVRVFLFHVLDDGVRYLLLRRTPRSEWPFGPVVGPIAPGEKMQDAVFREVRAETGLRRPVHLIELAQPSKELFGDIGCIDWPFAWQAATPAEPICDLHPGPMVDEVAWLGFEEAFRKVELQADRDALVRLQLILQ
jgi:ADP-ribose pyrophosphatase YjhB (NUDIX family)